MIGQLAGREYAHKDATIVIGGQVIERRNEDAGDYGIAATN